jgi:hypothetical protein
LTALTLGRCFWCNGRNRQSSDWEQENYAKGWQRLCKPSARVRLNNPWNALLNMRKVAAEPERITP